MRVRVYIDGFNLYYRRLRNSRVKWIDLKKLSSQLIQPDDRIDAIRYFTADVSPRAGDLSAPKRQQTYFRALKTIPELSIHKGKFLSKTIHRPLVGNEGQYAHVRDTEEKGSDVNLASHLLMDAFCDTYDIALVLSQDSDLLEPIRMVSQELNKMVIIGWMDNTLPGKRHKQVSSFVRHITEPMLLRSEFPNPVIGRGGARLFRPNEWNPTRSM